MEQLRERPLEDRLRLFQFLTSACSHLYSKNKLQEAKFIDLIPIFVTMTKEDPIFLAHLNSWAIKQDNKDLKVLTTFFNALSDADGTLFSTGSNFHKPNYRQVAWTALLQLEPKLVLRVLELARKKFEAVPHLSSGAHFPTSLLKAFKNYIVYRESNLDMLRGIRKGGLKNIMITIYRLAHMRPSPEAAGILGWKQRDGQEFVDTMKLDFTGYLPNEIAEEIRVKNISPLVALSVIENMNAHIAVALLEVASGDQAVILQNAFRRRGFLDIPEVNEIFLDKVKQATTTVDRIDTLSKNQTDEEKKVMSEVRSEKRKEQFSGIGSVYLHIDVSVSMQNAVEVAKERASIIAECVNDPEKNFNWGLFGKDRTGKVLTIPESFEKEAFEALLYGVRATEYSTNCVSCYAKAREVGAEVDIYFTDQLHNVGDITSKLVAAHELHPNATKPKAAIIVDFHTFGENGPLYRQLSDFGIPVEIMHPETLKESALVAQAVKTAIKGQSALVDTVMDVPLLQLPKWYNSKKLFDEYKGRFKTVESV